MRDCVRGVPNYETGDAKQQREAQECADAMIAWAEKIGKAEQVRKALEAWNNVEL